MRLQLLDTDRNYYLLKALYGLLMLLPQSSAFTMLRNRLDCVPNVHQLPPALKDQYEFELNSFLLQSEIINILERVTASPKCGSSKAHHNPTMLEHYFYIITAIVIVKNRNSFYKDFCFIFFLLCDNFVDFINFMLNYTTMIYTELLHDNFLFILKLMIVFFVTINSTLPKGKDYDVRKAVKKIDFSQLLDHFVQIQKTHNKSNSATKSRMTSKVSMAHP